MECGLMYVAAGEKFIEEARRSAVSAREHMPDISIAIKCDQHVDYDVFDYIFDLSDPYCDGRDRMYEMFPCPFDKTIFLDTDVYFCDSVHELFDFLDRFDLALAPNGQHYRSLELDNHGIPDAFPEYNGGVLCYNNTHCMRDFHNKWINTYENQSDAINNYNQPSLRQAIYLSDIQYLTLPRKYNCITWRPGYVSGKVKIFHGRLLDLETYGASETLEVQQAAKTLNSRLDNRVYFQSGNRLESRPSNLDRLKTLIHNNGVLNSIRMLIHHGVDKVKEIWK